MLSNFNLLFFIFLNALFPSFCYAFFSLWFTAGPQWIGTCLLSLSPEAVGKMLGKYAHAKSTLLKGIVGCLLAYVGWDLCPDRMGHPFYNCHVCILTVVTDAFLAACTVAFCPPESNRQRSYSPTECLWSPGWRGRVCPVSCRTLSRPNKFHGSLKKKKNILMYCYVFRKTSVLCCIKVVDFYKTSYFCPLLKFGPHGCFNITYVKIMSSLYFVRYFPSA